MQKEEIMGVGRPRKYATPEESKAVQREKMKQRQAESYLTKEGRAYSMYKNYQRLDLNARRGDCTLSPEWIVTNIYGSKCFWCGEDDWRKLGCDRIDNTKPHTEDNVICCCAKCNIERGIHSMDYFTKYQGSLSKAGTQLSLF